MAYGINKNNKFGKDNYIIPLAVGTHTEFVSALETEEKKCARTVGKPDSDVMRCLYRKGKSPVLYAKIDKRTLMHSAEDDSNVNTMKQRSERLHLDAIIMVESIFVSESVTTIQIKLYQAKILKEKAEEPTEWLL